jgi:hypothetical protein
MSRARREEDEQWGRGSVEVFVAVIRFVIFEYIAMELLGKVVYPFVRSSYEAM